MISTESFSKEWIIRRSEELGYNNKQLIEKAGWGLVYDGAITENVPGAVNMHPVSYDLRGITVAANVYTPAGHDPAKSYPAIVVAHPNGGVKEQVAGLYAQKMAEAGYITIAADASYQGASSGEPRGYDVPEFRIADSKYMSDEAFEKATGTTDKEYFIIEGATHIRTYFVPEYVEQISAKLTEFFGPRL